LNLKNVDRNIYLLKLKLTLYLYEKYLLKFQHIYSFFKNTSKPYSILFLIFASYTLDSFPKLF